MTITVPGGTDPITRALQQLASGRSNAIGTVTLASSGTTTVVSNDNCASGSTPLLTPVTAAGATEVGNGTMYVSGVLNGSFTITHSAGVANRSFRYCIIG